MTEEEQMLTEILQCRRVDLYLDQKPLNAQQQKQFEQMQLRRVQGEALQYILGSADFMGIKLFVDKRTLIPRPETEIMVADALEILKEMYSGQTLRILDAGTGSGNIAVAIAKNFSDCRVTAIDNSQTALEVAKKNAESQKVGHRVNCVYRDMRDFLDPLAGKGETFDLVISNPPYIRRSHLARLPKDVQGEPKNALDGGLDGLDHIRVLLSLSPRALAANGCLIFEFGDGQSEAIYKAFEYLKTFKHLEFKKDYRNTNRYAICRVQTALRV